MFWKEFSCLCMYERVPVAPVLDWQSVYGYWFVDV